MLSDTYTPSNKINLLVNILLFTILLTIICYFCYILLSNISLVFGDQHYALVQPASGSFIKPFIMAHIGRFNPLALQEINILLLFKKNISILYNTNIILICKFIAFILFTYFGLRFYYSVYIAIVGAIICCTLNFYQLYTFSEAIRVENSILLLFSAVFLFYTIAINTQKYKYFLIVGLISIIATYMKEPVSGMFFVMGCVNIMLRGKTISKSELYLSLFWVVNFIIFIAIYYIFIYHNTIISYVTGRQSSQFDSLLAYCNTINWIPIPFIVFRGFYFLRIRNTALNSADILMIGGIAYGLAYVILGFHTPYYFLPARFLMIIASILYFQEIIDYFGIYSRQIKKIFIIPMFIFLILIICFVQIKELNIYSRYMLERKDGTMRMLNFLQDCAERGYTLRYWLPPRETDRNVYTWLRGEHFGLQIPVYYYLHTGKKIDIPMYRRFFYEGLLRDYPPNMEPFKMANDFVSFSNTKSILILMPDSPGGYANKPWLEKPNDYLIIPLFYSTLIKREDLHDLTPVIHKYCPWIKLKN